MKRHGFTLIELLIVVAIIAILAAIAIPNFLNAQVRGKVARALSDLRTMRTAVEAYAADHNKVVRNTWGCLYDDRYGTPLHEVYGTLAPGLSKSASGAPTTKGLGGCVTTPVVYISTIPKDPFVDENYQGMWRDQGGDLYRYWSAEGLEIQRSMLAVCNVVGHPGYIWAQPSLAHLTRFRRQVGEYVLLCVGPKAAGGADQDMNANNSIHMFVQYDPTNGTVSGGSIYVTQKHFSPTYLDPAAVRWWDPL